jgi:hypothetical protein
MPLPRSLAHLKRGISEKKWAEARRWAGSRVASKKYRMPHEQRPDKVVAGSSKRLVSRFYRLKTGHCLTGQYLEWRGDRPTAAEVQKESGRGKDRFKVRDLLADTRCSQPVLDFLSTTDLG